MTLNKIDKKFLAELAKRKKEEHRPPARELRDQSSLFVGYPGFFRDFKIPIQRIPGFSIFFDQARNKKS